MSAESGVPIAAMVKGLERFTPDLLGHFDVDLLMYGNWYCHVARIDGELRVRRLDPSSLRLDDDGTAWIRVAP